MPEEKLKELLASNPLLQQEWDDEYGDRMQKIVFIGQKLDKKLIAKELDACLVEK